MLKRFRKDKTNIIIAHASTREADLIIVMEHGKIQQSGIHEELTKVDGWYRNQYIQQMTMK